MSHRTRMMCRALLFGTGIAALNTVHAQEQPKSQSASAPQVEEIIVTGSVIKRTDFETPSPVQVLSAEDMQQAGYTSVQQVLSNLAANGQGTLSQSFPGAFAGGGSGIALRGLTVGETLTLIDGQRMVAYPLSDDGERSFVDTSSIPLLAVDHIDVLKDGASAAYGSDAIAGVVNVVLKKSFKGFQFSAEGGTTSHGDGTNERVTGIAGLGDLVDNGYNAFVAVEWRHQDSIGAFSRSGAFTQQNWQPEGGANATPGAGSPGYYNFPAGTGAYLVPQNLAGATFQSLPPSSFLSSQCSSAAAIAADQCTYLPTREQIQPQTGNLNILARLTANLAGDWQAKVTGSFFQSNSQQVNGYTSLNNPGVPIQYPIYYPGFVGSSNPLTLTVPVGNPMNTSGSPEYPVATLFEAGQQSTNESTDTYRLFTEFTGKAGGWDMDLNLGEMYALTTATYLGRVNYQALQNALNNGYVFGTGGAGFAGVAPAFSSDFSDSLQVVDLRGSRPLFSLPGGPVYLALGGGFYHRYLDATQSQAAINSGTTVNLAYAEGGQTDYNAYGEVDAPILKNLELDVSGRYDHYNEGGSAAVPKVGLKWTIVPQVTFRGTFSEGYRAPTPAENGNAASAGFFTNAADPILCPSSNVPGQPPNANNLNPVVTPTVGDVAQYCNYGPEFVNGTNANLKPETSRSFTAGFVFKPVEQVNLSVDYWRTQVNNIILTDTEFGALPFPPAPINNVRSGPVSLAVINASGGTTPTLFPQGVPLYTLSSYENAGQILVDGLDVDLVTHFDFGRFGKITTQLNYSHEFDYNVSSCYAGQCATVDLAGTHGPSAISGDTGNPQDRAVLTVSWDHGPLDITATVNYVGHYSLYDPSLGETTCAQAVGDYGGIKFLTGVYPTQYCTVSHFTYVNLYGSYAINEHLQVFGSVDNLFNTSPPVDIATYGAGLLAYNPALAQAGAVGALFDVGFRYTF